MAEIRQARFPTDYAAVLAIFTEDVNSPSVSLAYQNYTEEFASLPGKYAPPAGRLLLAVDGERVLGFVPAQPVSRNPVPGTAFLGLDLRR